MNPEVSAALGALAGERFAKDSERRFIQMFGNVVDGIEGKNFEAALDAVKHDKGVIEDTALDAAALDDVIARYREVYQAETGRSFPDDPWEQLQRSIEAVFASWGNIRAVTYRRINQIPDDLGTAVNVQAMGSHDETPGLDVNFDILEHLDISGYIKDDLEKAVVAVAGHLGDKVRSLLIYGSLARGEWQPASSDVNLCVVMEEMDYEALEPVQEILSKARRRARVVTLVLTLTDLAEATDVFPIKFDDMALNLAEGMAMKGARRRSHLEMAYGSCREAQAATMAVAVTKQVDLEGGRSLYRLLDRSGAMLFRLKG